MFIPNQSLDSRVIRELSKHHLYIHKAVAVSVQKNDRRDDIPRGKPRRSVRTPTKRAKRADIIIIHLERSFAHDLEPMHDRLDRRKGVEVGIRGDLLEI